MLRKYILEHKLKKNLKARKSGSIIEFGRAGKVGIFFNDQEFNFDHVRELSHDLASEEREVTVLGYTPKLEHPVIYDVVVKNEISFDGTIKSREFLDFQNIEFDYLLSLNYDNDLTYLYLLSACKASCKVGFHESDTVDLQTDLQLKSPRGTALKDLAKYLKMIR